MSRGYWEELAQPLSAVREAALRLDENVVVPIAVAGGAAIRAQAIAVGLIVLAQSRPEGVSFEIQAEVDALHVWGANPSQDEVAALGRLGWHLCEIGGQRCWRCWI